MSEISWPPRRVLIESPFGRNVDGTRCTQAQYRRNTRYVREALVDSLLRGEAPFASHALYGVTRLDDRVDDYRRIGMEAGFAWGEVAELVAVYTDHGITPGMKEGIERWENLGIKIVYRSLKDDIRQEG